MYIYITKSIIKYPNPPDLPLTTENHRVPRAQRLQRIRKVAPERRAELAQFQIRPGGRLRMLQLRRITGVYIYSIHVIEYIYIYIY